MAITEPFSPEPLALFLTWTTYGSWLPGDDRGWSDDRGLLREPSHRLTMSASRRLADSAVSLTLTQRELVVKVITRHCQHRRWNLFAVACRLQHVHVVVSTPAYQPVTVSQQLKMWAARALAPDGTPADGIWTRGCSRRRIYDERGLQAVVRYVAECQDRPFAEHAGVVLRGAMRHGHGTGLDKGLGTWGRGHSDDASWVMAGVIPLARARGLLCARGR